MPTRPTTTGAAHLTAKGLSPKQRACPHPPQHVHATYDDRWETCDLCHIIRPRPLPAPWIVAWDESQPREEPPALFADLTTAPPARTRRTGTESGSQRIREQPETFGDLLRAARRDRQILGRAGPWQSPPLDDVYSPDQIATCHRCGGVGTIQDRTEVHASYPHPHAHHIPDPTVPARTCPRCQGAGRIPKYRTA